MAMRYFLAIILMVIVTVSFGQELYKQRSDINPSPALSLKKQRTDGVSKTIENKPDMFPKPVQDSLATVVLKGSSDNRRYNERQERLKRIGGTDIKATEVKPKTN